MGSIGPPGICGASPCAVNPRYISRLAHPAISPVGQLREHERNPRSDDVGAIFQSIEPNGFYGGIVAQRSSGRILVFRRTRIEDPAVLGRTAPSQTMSGAGRR